MRHFVSLAVLQLATGLSSGNYDSAPGGRSDGVKALVTRDTWFSNVEDEANGNCGGAQRLKVKSIQEMSLVDIDPAPFRGRVIRAATLHLRSTGEPRLRRVTVSSFGSEWVEGTATDYEKQKGSSTHNRRQHPDVFWAGPGSDLCSVILGQAGTIWRMADATPPDADGWQQVPVEPAVVAAHIAGVSHGFLLFDDTGSEWTRNGEKFKVHLFPNRFVYSREAGPERAPYFTIFPGAEDKLPPAAPTEITADVDGLPAGEARISWTTPKDDGPAGTAGFFVTVNGKDVPRYLIPAAGRPGERVRMHLRDLNLESGAQIAVTIKAVDGAGNVGPAGEASVHVSAHEAIKLPGKALASFKDQAELPTVAGVQMAVIDELDKVQPLTGAMIPEQPAGYLAANHLWSAKDESVRLHAARNEYVAFQILLRGSARAVRPTLTFEAGAGDPIFANFTRYAHVATKKGLLPDPVIPLESNSIAVPDLPAAGMKTSSLHCEIWVPHGAASGLRHGTLTLQAGRETLTLKVALRVWNFTLPDYLSFLPEMNAYELPANERDYYRMAHIHRTVLNKVPYYQSGEVQAGCAPRWTGRQFDWREFDRRFGPLFTGEAFRDLPRSGVPIECFYLPLHENWPSAMAGNYNGSYWADRAFPPAYRATFVEAARQFANHAERANWSRTLFHFYLNGKNNFKENGWSRASSPWLLDEPANFQDYWALRWFAAAFHEGVRQARPGASMLFRADISRPEWQRDALDGLLDYNVVGSAFRRYRRMVLDRKSANGEIVLEYGSTNALEDANMQPVGWCLDAWCLGADGVVPWQTVGADWSWKKADENALFYPGATPNEGVAPSVRLKAYRRGQQDVEYLTLLTRQLKQPRWAVGDAARAFLKLSAERKGTQTGGIEDAGVIHYAKLKPQDAWALRVQIGEALSQAAPKPQRRLVAFRPPRRDPSSLPPAYVSVSEVKAIPETTAKVEKAEAKTVQGRPAVRDVLIDPTEPFSKLGGVPRGNALRKAKESSAFLVHFDLDSLKLPKDAKISKATVSFFVWDPSSQGTTKVVAFPLKMAWTEAEATWQQPAEARKWKGGGHFSVEADAGPAAGHVVVKPDMGSDTVDPPLEYQIDVTSLVKSWVLGESPNHGLAIVPVSDRAIDDGAWTRLQIYASENREEKYGPKLTVAIGQ